MAIMRQAQDSWHAQIKPQSCDKLFSPLQTPELSTWNWDGQAGRQRPCRAPSPGIWGCRTSSGSRHCRHRAAPGPAQERQDGWQPGHRGREPSESQLSQGEGQGTAFPDTGTRPSSIWSCLLQPKRDFRKIFCHHSFRPQGMDLFLNKADEQIKNCSPVPQADNSPLISATVTVSSISLGGTARTDRVKSSHEAEIHLPNFRFSHYCTDDLSLGKSTRCAGISYQEYVELHIRGVWNFIPQVCGISYHECVEFHPPLEKTWKQRTFISAAYTKKKKSP